MNDNHPDHASEHNKTTIIIVNGRQKEVTGKTISYSHVVQLAYPNDQANDTIEYTVAYANPHGKDGTLVEGQSVHIKKGMIFNVTKTNRS
jgi:Multiubiquitin